VDGRIPLEVRLSRRIGARPAMAHATPSIPDAGVVVDPPIAAFVGSMLAHRARTAEVAWLGRSMAAWKREARRSLGLDDLRPLAMTGHQPGLWHAGILAKWLVVDAICAVADAASAALVVDQDVVDPASIAYPSLDGGTLHAATLPTPRPHVEARSIPVGLRPPVAIGAPTEAPLPEIAARLDAIRAAMNAARPGAASLAAQTAGANEALLRDRGVVRSPLPSVPATRLLEVPFAAALLDRMRADPAACIAAYNDALRAASARDPRIARPLGPRELPLWSFATGTRTPVVLGDERGPFAPRAFLMTAIARLVLCDGFVHGTGGGAYERVTEAWIRGWLGLEPAPMLVATATLRLPLERLVDGGSALTPTELHRIEFDPDLAEEPSGPVDGRRSISPSKQRLVEAIAAAAPGSAERRDRYRDLHRVLGERRIARRDELERLRAIETASRSRAAAIEVARSRVWPWPLHDDDAIASLKARIAERS
jgi:hypothetical protein